MATQGEKINVLFPNKVYEEMKDIVELEGKWISIQEFIREAVYEKIDRWKKEHDAYGHPERIKKENK